MPVWYLNPYPWQKLNDYLLTLVFLLNRLRGKPFNHIQGLW